jgi:hypothetical protein
LPKKKRTDEKSKGEIEGGSPGRIRTSDQPVNSSSHYPQLNKSTGKRG